MAEKFLTNHQVSSTQLSHLPAVQTWTSLLSLQWLVFSSEGGEVWMTHSPRSLILWFGPQLRHGTSVCMMAAHTLGWQLAPVPLWSAVCHHGSKKSFGLGLLTLTFSQTLLQKLCMRFVWFLTCFVYFDNALCALQIQKVGLKKKKKMHAICWPSSLPHSLPKTVSRQRLCNKWDPNSRL